MSNFTPGPTQVIPMQIHGLPVSVFICYESAYPMEIREAAHSDYIITLSDDSWFGRSLGPYQHQEIAVMRAIETGRPILRATNSGVTSIINSQGQIVASAPLFIATILQGEITPVTGMTPWLNWGIEPVIVFTLLLLFLARIFPFMQKKKAAYVQKNPRNWLLGICSGILSNTSLTPNNNYCAGFIQGIMLAWYTAQTQINPQGAAFWLNQFGSIPALKSAQMVTHYLVQNPQSLNQSAVSLIIAAMNLNYPIPPAIGS